MTKTRLALLLLLLFGLFGCGPDGPAYRPRDGIKFRLGEYQPGPGLVPAQLPDGRRQVYLHLDLVLASRDIDYIRNSGLIDGQWVIDFRFTEQGGQRMLRTTQENIGRPLGIEVNGKLVSFATISGVIKQGLRLPVSSAAEAQALIDALAIKPANSP